MYSVTSLCARASDSTYTHAHAQPPTHHIRLPTTCAALNLSSCSHLHCANRLTSCTAACAQWRSGASAGRSGAERRGGNADLADLVQALLRVLQIEHLDGHILASLHFLPVAPRVSARPPLGRAGRRTRGTRRRLSRFRPSPRTCTGSPASPSPTSPPSCPSSHPLALLAAVFGPCPASRGRTGFRIGSHPYCCSDAAHENRTKFARNRAERARVPCARPRAAAEDRSELRRLGTGRR